MESSLTSEKLQFLHTLLDKELEGLMESSLNVSKSQGLSSHTHSQQLLLDSSLRGVKQQQQNYNDYSSNLATPVAHELDAFHMDDMSSSNNHQQQQYERYPPPQQQKGSQKTQMNSELQDLQSKISNIEKRIQDMNKQPSNSALGVRGPSPLHHKDKDSSSSTTQHHFVSSASTSQQRSVYQSTNDAATNNRIQSAAFRIEHSFSKPQQQISPTFESDTEEDEQDSMKAKGENLTIKQRNRSSKQGKGEHSREADLKGREEGGEVEEETPLKRRYSRKHTSKDRSSLQSYEEKTVKTQQTLPRQCSASVKTRPRSSSAQNLPRSGGSSVNTSTTSQSSGRLLRYNAIEQRISEAEGALSRNPMKRQSSSSTTRQSHLPLQQPRPSSSERKLPLNRGSRENSSTLQNVRQLELVIANHNEVAVLNKKMMQLKKYQEADRQLLIKERLRGNELQENLDLLNRKLKKMTSQIEKSTAMEEDYKKLLASFEKSEFVRAQQKQLIASLKAEIESNNNLNYPNQQQQQQQHSAAEQSSPAHKEKPHRKSSKNK